MPCLALMGEVRQGQAAARLPSTQFDLFALVAMKNHKWQGFRLPPNN